MKHVLYIHGGDAKENYRNFEESLAKLNFDPNEKLWSDFLQEDLGKNNFEILLLDMPTPSYADYEEWKDVFENKVNNYGDELIIIAHSLGTAFILKYIEENDILFDFEKIIFVSTLYKDTNNEILGTFKINRDFKRIKKYERKFVFFHSEEDEISPIEHLKQLQKLLINSDYIILKNKGHFLQEKFPELIDYIKKLN